MWYVVVLLACGVWGNCWAMNPDWFIEPSPNVPFDADFLNEGSQDRKELGEKTLRAKDQDGELYTYANAPGVMEFHSPTIQWFIQSDRNSAGEYAKNFVAYSLYKTAKGAKDDVCYDISRRNEYGELERPDYYLWSVCTIHETTEFTKLREQGEGKIYEKIQWLIWNIPGLRRPHFHKVQLSVYLHAAKVTSFLQLSTRLMALTLIDKEGKNRAGVIIPELIPGVGGFRYEELACDNVISILQKVDNEHSAVQRIPNEQFVVHTADGASHYFRLDANRALKLFKLVTGPQAGSASRDESQ